MTNKENTVLNLENVKIVLGNGYDLFCGLKTKYKDYFSSNPSKNTYIKSWLNEFMKDLCISPMSYVNFSLKENKDFWLDCQGFEELSVWDFFFYLVSDIQPDVQEEWCWCDIEKVMQRWLYEPSDQNEYIENSSWYTVYRLLSGNYSKSCDGKIYVLASIIYKKNNEQCIYSIDKFYNFLLIELKKFERKFGYYIDNLIHDRTNESFGIVRYRNNYSLISRALIEKLCAIDNISSIESFNYDFIEVDELKNKFHNINGSINSPIFGVDSSLFFAPDPRYIFTKTNRRMELDMDTDDAYAQEEFNNIVFFGHSLTASDYSYFFSIFDKIDIIDLTKKSKIVFAYAIYDEELEDKIKSDYRLAIFSLFQEYSIYKGNKDAPNRLLDALTTQGKIILYEIK